MTDTNEKKVHQGRNVKRFREMLRLTQDGFATELGEDWTQRRVSLLEGKEEIEGDLLEQVAKALKVPTEAIENLDDDGAINIISNTFHDFKDNAIASAMNYQCSFNPLDKVMQLYDEKIGLYERMLKEKSEMIEKMEKLLSQK